MPAILVEFYRFHTWANLRLLGACAGLSDAQLDAVVPGTYGAIRRTLVHLLGNEEHYLGLLGHPLADRLAPGPSFAGFPDLERRARRSGALFQHLAAEADAGRVLTGERDGEAYAIPLAIPLMQVIVHGTEHRAHINTTLAQQGLPTLTLDAWAYNDAADKDA